MDEIIGQKRAVNTLMRSFNSGKRHHALIFSGPRGVGKFTTAMAYAELVLQQSGSPRSPHPDLHVIKKEDVAWSPNPLLRNRKQTNIPLDLLKERMIGGKTSDDKSCDAIAYKTPVCGNEKVFIIDEAELLDDVGQNALLKTLEEPPTDTTIILVTCRDDRLLPTVHSRCHPVMFSPLDEDSMKKWAQDALVDVSTEDANFAILFSDGSPGIASETILSSLPELARTISSFLDLNNRSNYVDAVDAIIAYVSNSVDAQLKENPLASKEAANRIAAQKIFMLFGRSVRAMVRGDRQVDGIVAAGILSDVEGQLSTNISIKVLLESLAARWTHLCTGDAVLA